MYSSSTDSSDIGGLSRSHNLSEACHDGVHQQGIQGFGRDSNLPEAYYDGMDRPGSLSPIQDSSIGFGYVP